IKTYVSIGLGVGIVAEMAWDATRDAPLRAVPAGSLFGMNRVRLALRRDASLRGFATAFIELFLPGTRL
ncbi:MAG: transcriptional regulator, partial [Burkholderiales bacterium]